MSVRKSTGKRLRFSIFARDNFTCRYCGKQSDSVELQIDHLIPVCKGGTNDESNLVTSCVPCNQGKAGIKIEQAAPNEIDRLRLSQELQEQKQAAERARDIINVQKERRDSLKQWLSEATGREFFNKPTFSVLFSYVLEYGEEMVYGWIDKASTVCSGDQNIGRYVSGCRRQFKAQQQEETSE